MALKQLLTVTGPATVRNGEVTVSAGEQSVQINAYIKVQSVQGSKDQVGVVVSFSGNNAWFQRLYSFTPSLEGPNFIRQAYEHLKTLSEFAGATDC